MSRLGGLVAFLAFVAFAPSVSAAVPGIVPLAARVTSADGVPIRGLLALKLRIYDAGLAGNVIWEEAHRVTAVDGLLYVDLGSVAPDQNPLDGTIFDGGDLWLEMVVNGEVQSPRVQIGSVPYAIHAENADLLGGLPPHDYARVGHTHPYSPEGHVHPYAADNHVHALRCVSRAGSAALLLHGSGTSVAQSCGSGELVVGGGCKVADGTSSVYLIDSYPTSTGWQCRWKNTTTKDHSGQAVAICCPGTNGPQPPPPPTSR